MPSANQNKINFFWFRRDLRLLDNSGLYHALNSGLPVQCVFIFDTEILNKLDDKHDARVEFIQQQLENLHNELKKFGSALLTSYDTPQNAWKQWLEKFSIHEVFTNNDYEPYAIERDLEIEKLLKERSISFKSFKDHVVFEKLEIAKEDGKPYTIFTPYKNRYLQTLTPEHLKTFSISLSATSLNQVKAKEIHTLESIGFKPGAMKFPESYPDRSVLENYELKRDYPGENGTSRMGIHLRFGTVSTRQLFNKAMKLPHNVWLNELIWREFFQMILWNFPYVEKSAFKPAYNKIRWRNNEKEFERWCEGNTGYPMVDAGMRELNATGFMHNRVRMVTASFLVKHLLIDWRWGEAYFASKLLDFDLAANNGGWQWAAGSGCDAAPYFRIFNPMEQARKFDPELKYIRKWIPEYDSLEYPQPIVDHKMARERCLKVYAAALGKN